MDIVALRNNLALSRAALGRVLCVHETTVFRWENGSAKPQGLEALVLEALEAAMIKVGADQVQSILSSAHLSTHMRLLRILQLAIDP